MYLFINVYAYVGLLLLGPLNIILSLPLPALGSFLLRLSPCVSANAFLLLLCHFLLLLSLCACHSRLCCPLLPAVACCCPLLLHTVAAPRLPLLRNSCSFCCCFPLLRGCLCRLREWTLYSTSPSPLCRPQVLFRCCFLSFLLPPFAFSPLFLFQIMGD